MRGESCKFSHRKDFTNERVADKIVDLSETKIGELGIGKSGWVPTGDISVLSLKPYKFSSTEDEQLFSKGDREFIYW